MKNLPTLLAFLFVLFSLRPASAQGTLTAFFQGLEASGIEEGQTAGPVTYTIPTGESLGFSATGFGDSYGIIVEITAGTSAGTINVLSSTSPTLFYVPPGATEVSVSVNGLSAGSDGFTATALNTTTAAVVATETYNITVTPATLPVSWGDELRAVHDGKRTTFSWSVGAEENVATYAVEVAGVDEQFVAIGERAADERPAPKGYELSAADLPPSGSYFRVRQVDADGKFSYSPIAELPAFAGEGMRVYPNPSDGMVRISLPGPTEGAISTGLYSMAGQLMGEPKITDGTMNLRAFGLPAGNYLLVVRHAGQTLRQLIQLW